MTLSGTSTDLCPNLTSLVYGIGAEFPSSLFFAMVRSRFEPQHPRPGLATLRLFDARNFVYSCAAEVATEMQMLYDEGFDTTFLQLIAVPKA